MKKRNRDVRFSKAVPGNASLKPIKEIVITRECFPKQRVLLVKEMYQDKNVSTQNSSFLCLSFFRIIYSNPLQYSCLENPMDGGAWWATVHGVTKSRTRLIDFTFTFHFHALEKEMATHSSVLVQRIPGTGAWWAAVYGVTQGRTRLKRLSSSSGRII